MPVIYHLYHDSEYTFGLPAVYLHYISLLTTKVSLVYQSIYLQYTFTKPLKYPFYKCLPCNLLNLSSISRSMYIHIIYINAQLTISYTSSTAQGGGGSFKNRKPIGEIGCCESGMAERIHWWTERCLRSPLFLSLSLTIYPPTNLYSMYLCIYVSMYLCIYVSIYVSIYLSIYLSIYPSIHLSIYPSIHLSIYPSIHLSIYPSIYRI